MDAPIVLLIFNRPQLTSQVFAEVARARPNRLLVVADGPRFEEEEQRCAAARAVIERVDWDCQVLRNYSDVNLGLKRRVASGLDWVFEHCEAAIILEDDCLPHPSFFRFCEELLDRYRHDERVGTISGNNFQFGRKRGRASYYFSRFVHIWGWATWRRAWRRFDGDIQPWPALRDTDWLTHIVHNAEAVAYWQKILDRTFAGEIDSWGYPWLFTCWTQEFLTVIPQVNLVSNLGFGEGATHTRKPNKLAFMPTEAMNFPLKHPSEISRNLAADRFTMKHDYLRKPVPSFVHSSLHTLQRFYRLLPDPIQNLYRALKKPLSQ